MSENLSNQKPSHELITLIVLIMLISAWRLSIMLFQQLDLYVDEAQYWDWAQTLQWGYYSKPPVIAGIISLSTSLCGSDAEHCIRAGSLLLYPLTTLTVYAITFFLFNNRQYAFYAALAFFTLPAVAVSSLIISTDVALFLFWSLALLGFIRALQTDQVFWWAWTGIAGGLGLMSKYTMGIFAISVIIYLLWSKQLKVLLRPGIWLTAVIAFLIWLPNLWWNSQHEFITFTHTGEIAQADDLGLQFDELFEFLGGQLLVFGLLMFPLLAYVLFKTKPDSNRKAEKNNRRLLITFTLTFLFIICYQALSGRANMNWAAPAYLAGSILVTTSLLMMGRKKLLIAAISLNLITMTVVHYLEPIAEISGITLNKHSDIYSRMKGWRDIGQQFDAIRKQYPDTALIANRRNVLSNINYYADPVDVYSWNPTGNIKSHFDLHHSLTDKTKQKRFLVVQKYDDASDLSSYFSSYEAVGELFVEVYPKYKRHYVVFLAEHFKGYTP